MTILHKLRVESSRAYLESAPPFVAGTTEMVCLEVTFDQSWDGFSIALLAEQEGADLQWRLCPDENGRAELPAPLTQGAVPFFLWAEGERDGKFLRTNSVCIAPEALCTGDGEEPTEKDSLPVYARDYRVTENGVYPTKNHYLTENLTVDVPPIGSDTSEDTVSPRTLLEGITAHDALGQPIVGAIPAYSVMDPAVMTSVEGITLPTEGTYCGKNLSVIPMLEVLDVTENGRYTPGEGFAGVGSVTVDVRPPLQAKTAVANGTVIPDEGYYGLSGVEVQVPAQGVLAASRACGENVVCESASVTVAIQVPVITAIATATGELTA